MKKHNCEQCKLRKKYDDNPKSFIGRLWRWHINFCPGWRKYTHSLDGNNKAEVVARYKLKPN